MTTLTESANVESAALAWLEIAGWTTARAPDIPRDDTSQTILEPRLRDALTALNPRLPADALDDAIRKLARPDGATVEVRNRSFHRTLVNGAEIEYRDANGAIQGDVVRVLDFRRPARQRLS